MQWVKLAATPAYYHDGALLRAGEAAEVLFLRGLAYCGSNETQGRIAKAALPLIVTSRGRQRADALVREGLWTDEGDHYFVRSWDVWQEEHDAAAERRRRDRERKRQARRQIAAETSVERPRNVRGQRGTCPQSEGEGEREVEDVDVKAAVGRASADEPSLFGEVIDGLFGRPA